MTKFEMVMEMVTVAQIPYSENDIRQYVQHLTKKRIECAYEWFKEEGKNLHSAGVALGAIGI